MYRSDTQSQVTSPLKGQKSKLMMQDEPFLRHAPTRDGGVNGVTSPQRKSGRKYETFVMTGDMMIRTTSDHNDHESDLRIAGKNKEISLDNDTTNIQDCSVNKRKKTEHSKSKIPKFNTSGVPSPKVIPRNSSIPTAVVNTNQNKSPVLGPIKSPKKVSKKPKHEGPAQEAHTGLPVYTKQMSMDSPKTSKKQIPHHVPDILSPLSSPKIKVKGAAIANTKHASSIPTKMSKIPTKDIGQPEKSIVGVLKESPVTTEPLEDTWLTPDQVTEVSGERICSNDSIKGVPSSSSSAVLQPGGGQDNSSVAVLSEEISTSSDIAEHDTQGNEASPPCNNNAEKKHMDSTSAKPEDPPVKNVLADEFPAITDLFPSIKQSPQTEQFLNSGGYTDDNKWSPGNVTKDLEQGPVMEKRSPFEEFHRPVYHTCNSQPIQLDIPPDDICSEDERYSCSEEGLFDVDNLPPPPEELLRDFEEEKMPDVESVQQDIHIGGAFFVESIRHRGPYGNNTMWTPSPFDSDNTTQHRLPLLQQSSSGNTVNTLINTHTDPIEGRNVISSVPKSILPLLHAETEFDSRGNSFSAQNDEDFHKESSRSESIDVKQHSIISRENTQLGTAALRDCNVTGSDQSHTNEQNIGSSIINNVAEGSSLHYNTMTSIAAVSNKTVSAAAAVGLLNGEQGSGSIHPTPAVSTGASVAVNTALVSSAAGENAAATFNSSINSSHSAGASDPVADLFTSSTFVSPNTTKTITPVSAVDKLLQHSSLSATATQRTGEPLSVSRCNINDRAQPAPVFPSSEDLHRGSEDSSGSGSKARGPRDIHEELLDHALESQAPMERSFNVPTPPTGGELAFKSRDLNRELDYLSQVVTCKAANTATDSSLITPGSTYSDGSEDQMKNTAETVQNTDDQLEGNSDTNNGAVQDEQEAFTSVDDECQTKRGMVTSFSGEGFAFKTLPNKASQGHGSSRDSPMLVRTSKSHENYLDNQDMTMINIDLGDDFASSVDALHYEQSSTSLDKLNGYPHKLVEQSKSLDNSPERRYDKYSEKIHMPTFFRIDEPGGGAIGSKMRDSAAQKMKHATKPVSDGSDSSGSLGEEVSPTRTTQATEEPLSPTYSVKSEGSSPIHKSYPYTIGGGSGVVVQSDGVIHSKDKKFKQKKPKLKSAGSSPAHEGGSSISSSKKTHAGYSQSSPSSPYKSAPVVEYSSVPGESQDGNQTNSEHSQSEVSDVLSDKEENVTSDIVNVDVGATNVPVQNGFMPESVNSNINNDNNTASGISNTSNDVVNKKLKNCDFQVEEFSSEPKSPRRNVSQSSKPPETTIVPESVQTSKSRQSPKHKKTKTEKFAVSEADNNSVTPSAANSPGKSKSPHKEGHKKHRSPKNKKKGHIESPNNKLKFLEGDDVTPPPPYSAPGLTQQSHGTETSLIGPRSLAAVTHESPVRQAQDTAVVTISPREISRAEPVSKAEVPPPQLDVVPSGSGPSSPDSDTGSIYHQPLKDVDLPSAQRLAKRLFDLEGFKKKDISKHLSKKNDFAQQVGEEFLKYFDFSDEGLDSSLRKFLRHITLAGETQERERVLVHFSHRYLQCNPDSYNSEDAAHTLTCALLLLNTDLHGQNVGQKMSLSEFIENLSDLNDGENFPKEVLKSLYHSIKTEPLEWEFDEGSDGLQLDLLQATTMAAQRPLPVEQQKYLGHNPFLDVPDPNNAIEYKKGYVMRKCCVDPDGRKTAVGKRGWKMFYGVLKDMIFYLYKDEHAYKKRAQYDNINNAVRVHHSLTTRAVDYKKKQHVFRLQTAEWAEYLFQTSSPEECQNWIDNLNIVAATYSAPPLPGAVGSQRKFQRPLLPATCTKYNLPEQYQHHEQKMQQLDRDLTEHRKYPPEKGSKARVIQEYVEKEQYIQFELRRFKTYCYVLQSKLASGYPSDLEPSLVETTICEVSEPSSPGSEPKDSEVALSRASNSSSTTSTTSSSSSSSSSPKSSSSSSKKSPKRTDRKAPPGVEREKRVKSSVQRSQSDRVNRDRKARSMPERVLLQRYRPGVDDPDSYGTPV